MDVILWCWDARMTWDDEPSGAAVPVAVANQAFPYRKRPEAFNSGFRRLIDYCAQTGIRGVIIWGFLRESHGGVEDAQRLCAYAADHGVEIIPGVGLCSYGGFFFEGDHPFNLQTYLRRHPEKATMAHDAGLGKIIGPVLDPSDPDNHRWWRDGVEWMLDTFRIGGINFEMGDHLIHPSPRACAMRESLGLTCQENIQDMVVATRDLMRHALDLKPAGRFINSTYLPYARIADFPVLGHAAALPPEAIWMYTMGGEVSAAGFPGTSLGGTPHRKGAYLHWGRAGSNQMCTDYRDALQNAIAGLATLDFEFVSLYGETAPSVFQGADRNYRTAVDCARSASKPPR